MRLDNCLITLRTVFLCSVFLPIQWQVFLFELHLLPVQGIDDVHAEDADQEDQARVDDVAGNSRNVSSDNVCHDDEEEE